jgi:hypothetical protein
MGEMIARLGIEPSSQDFDDGGHLLGEAVRSCYACLRGEECRAWLRARPELIEAAPGFCPNAVRFQAMRSGR